MNAGNRTDHNQFCVNDQWEKARDARGREVGHHVTCELALPDGRILRTRISRPLKKETYGPTLWKTILRDQLEVTEDDFWACVKDEFAPTAATTMCHRLTRCPLSSCTSSSTGPALPRTRSHR